MTDTLEPVLDALRAGGAATGGDWTLTWDGRVSRYILTRADNTVVLFTRDDLLDYARREPVLFGRRWLMT